MVLRNVFGFMGHKVLCCSHTTVIVGEKQSTAIYKDEDGCVRIKLYL